MINAGSIMVDWGEEKKVQIAGRLPISALQ